MTPWLSQDLIYQGYVLVFIFHLLLIYSTSKQRDRHLSIFTFVSSILATFVKYIFQNSQEFNFMQTDKRAQRNVCIMMARCSKLIPVNCNQPEYYAFEVIFNTVRCQWQFSLEDSWTRSGSHLVDFAHLLHSLPYQPLYVIIPVQKIIFLWYLLLK